MMSRLRTTATWVTLGLFGEIALAGHGLHMIPGMGHRCDDPHGCEQRCASHTHPPHAQYRAGDGGCFTCGHSDSPVNPHAELTALPSLADGHVCPICRFFATTKPLLATVAEAELSEAVAPVCPCNAPARPIYRAAVYRSRAPPRG